MKRAGATDTLADVIAKIEARWHEIPDSIVVCNDCRDTGVRTTLRRVNGTAVGWFSTPCHCPRGQGEADRWRRPAGSSGTSLAEVGLDNVGRLERLERETTRRG